MSIYIAMCIYWKILHRCLTLTCGYKMGDMSPPMRSAKLKIIYGSKTSKTADLDTISIQIFYIHMCYVYGWWLLSRGAPAPPKWNPGLARSNVNFLISSAVHVPQPLLSDIAIIYVYSPSSKLSLLILLHVLSNWEPPTKCPAVRYILGKYPHGQNNELF